ncbi:hypothetical protein [Streptomyces rishiriensis]|uniref:hypothetical protein n=1 Tax=Streptomyces rishiriensis TaxID=68264 RepID=UPI00131F4689|nr:hypothetical protein [Streptomyces rishiriensis]
MTACAGVNTVSGSAPARAARRATPAPLLRHRDLLGRVHAHATWPPPVPRGRGPAVSLASLQADLPSADARTARFAARVRRLEARLSEVLGEQVWREAGIGGPDDTEQLQARITTLEQLVVNLELKLQDQADHPAAARAANRELMSQLNRDPTRRD